MRPAKTSQGNLVAPLNRILGTEANVRLLRVLSGAREPLTRPDVARLAQMDTSGVRRALDSLAAEGIVETVGAGARTPVRLRTQHPLASAIRRLFVAERSRAEEVVEAVREIGTSLSPQPRALWLTLPVQREPDSLETMHLGVLASAREVDAIARSLRNRLRDVQRRYDVPIEVRACTLADLQTFAAEARAELAAAQPILGPAPAGFLAGDAPHAALALSQSRGHARQDRRALLLGRAIGERISRDPTLIERAREYARRMASSSPGVRQEMEEWEEILDTLPPARLRAFLGDPGERATRLRQSLPFMEVLAPAEREDLFRKANRDAQPA